MSARTNSPRILYVSQIFPHKADFGGELRCLNVARALREMGIVEVVVLDEENRKSIAEPDSEFPLAYALDVKPQPKKGLIGKVRSMLDPQSDYPHGCGVGHDAMHRVRRSLEDFDLVWFFRLRSADLFPNAAWQSSVVDVDDLPSTYDRATLQVGGGPRERVSARRSLLSWRRREKLLGDRFTVLSVCSEEDLQYLRQLGVESPIHVIPNGFERPLAEPVRSLATPPRIGFIGLFDYFPNRDGIDWFANKCWPRIKRDVPDARLRLVGKDSDGFLKRLSPDIDRLGWVASPSEEMKTWSAMVVPIRLGTGTRIKIAHAFSEKCPVVSTSHGAFGYKPMDEREMYIGDSAEAFSDACVKAIREPEKAAQMAERAWRLFLEKWTWDAIRPTVWAAAEDCLRLNAQSCSVTYGNPQSAEGKTIPETS